MDGACFVMEALSGYLVWILRQLWKTMVPVGWMKETDSECVLRTRVE